MLKNDKALIKFDEKNSCWSVEFLENRISILNVHTSINLNGSLYQLSLLETGESNVKDKIGNSIERVFQCKSECLAIKVNIHLRLYEDEGLIGVFGHIENDGEEEILLHDFAILNNALVKLGGNNSDISAHIARGIAHPNVVKLVEYEGDGDSKKAKNFIGDSNGMATLTDTQSNNTITLGFVTGEVNKPIVSLKYDSESDEVRFSGIARFNGMTVYPGESIQTDLLILQAENNPFSSLEKYASLIGKIKQGRKTKSTTGWCSWYAIRLPISHEFTMANARVVADRFKDLGMDIMLLDHGWQTGDICGDWDEDIKDYPKGLEGLAKDLEDIGLKLGIWIAPTEVAETSRLFKDHPDWMLRNREGKPQETWRWYWYPNPQQYQLDATNPFAYQYIVDTFRSLTEKGSVYYKIDFIAGCAGENLYPSDPCAVRGWSPLQSAMRAVREGAGNSAYIRYCQTPPLLSIGLADGVFATSDTLDAGATTWNVLRDVFKMSSAQYYLHGLYNHDACDLSIRGHAGTEECRLRVMMFALSGSSIMFSDDLTKLPEERIVMMQQSMPPFEIAARPINLFTSEVPDIWHLHCSSAGIEWELIALFNFEENQKNMTVSWKDIGLPDDQLMIAREFWTEEYIGIKSQSFTVVVPGLAGRLYSLWRLSDKPQYVGTNLHLSQGLAELSSISWDENTKKLSGVFKRAKSINGKAYFHVPESYCIKNSSHKLMQQNGGLWAMDLNFDESSLNWEISF